MGVGVSLLLQFSLTSGGYPSVGRSRRSSRRSIPGNIPRRSWAKPHLQLHSLQGRVWPSLLDSRTISWPQCPAAGGGGERGEKGGLRAGGEGGCFRFITSWESSQGSVWPLGMSHVSAPGEEYRFGGTSGELVSRQ